ncbi:MAG: PilZ domain-containing protein [Hyalangium sp.]|uniref:PilZ domain-containing protein n=1 Tax=Hyalangium sp. TaxID=2028555 RepID=UPI00389A47F3
MSQPERRRHQRYPLRLPIKVHYRDQELSADIINASASGCLLQMGISVEPGETLEVSIPQLNMPKAKLVVVRSESSSSGFMVATVFDSQMADEPSLSRLSSEKSEPPGGGSTPPTTK